MSMQNITLEINAKQQIQAQNIQNKFTAWCQCVDNAITTNALVCNELSYGDIVCVAEYNDLAYNVIVGKLQDDKLGFMAYMQNDQEQLCFCFNTINPMISRFGEPVYFVDICDTYTTISGIQKTCDKYYINDDNFLMQMEFVKIKSIYFYFYNTYVIVRKYMDQVQIEQQASLLKDKFNFSSIRTQYVPTVDSGMVSCKSHMCIIL